MLRFTSFSLCSKGSGSPATSAVKHNIHKTSHPRIFTMDAITSPTKPHRGVAALVGWLYCKPQSLRKYATVYAENGFDSVIVTCDWKHVMRPEEGRKLMESLEHEINARHLKQAVALNTRTDELDKNVAVHAFSMGAYMTSLWTHNMRKSDHKHMLNSIKCQSFDSPADYDNVPRGIGLATFKNEAAAGLLEATVTNALKMFPAVREEHIAASKRFWNEPLEVPAMWYYSAEDPISPASVCEKVMDCWRKKGLEVEGVIFENTKHVCHMKHFPDKYRSAMESFLDKHMPAPKK